MYVASSAMEIMKNQRKQSVQSAFTLTELLVTIGIVDVVGSIFMTGLVRSKLKGFIVKTTFGN